ncbi:MAG: cyclic pyranopterin monophosphate synthase MoaC [Pseudomonadota bacterium]|nr:cyclic pyranopterin monophosphate synthase MoaC [Pseudomonadota bacterium]
MSRLTHLDDDGRARMVDVSAKESTLRIARSGASLICSAETLAKVRQGKTPKGSVTSTAELAGVMAAKRTSDLIPLCHPLPLHHVEVRIDVDEDLPGFRVTSEVRTRGPTGVEMEALTAASVACLTLFDMLKAIDRTMLIGDIRILSKTGGKSGDWTAEQP